MMGRGRCDGYKRSAIFSATSRLLILLVVALVFEGRKEGERSGGHENRGGRGRVIIDTVLGHHLGSNWSRFLLTYDSRSNWHVK